MGIYNRDYIREDRPGGSFGLGSYGWAIKYIVIANVAVFLVQQVDPRVTELLSLRVTRQTAAQTNAWTIPFRASPEQAAQYLPVGKESIPDVQLPAGTYLQVLDREGAYARVLAVGDFGGTEAWIARDYVALNWMELLQVWRFLTYGFCHSGLMHIFFNMYMLYIFGQHVEPIYGSREFLAFYLVSIVMSALAYVGIEMFHDISTSMVGASGGVMAVTFLAARHFPTKTILFMFVLPLEYRWLALLYAVGDLSGMFSGGTGVAHAAHLGGAAFGLAYYQYGWRVLGGWSDTFRSWRMPRRRIRLGKRPEIQLYQPPRESLDAEVDSILDKIHREGEAALTEEERAVLKDASQRYKNKL